MEEPLVRATAELECSAAVGARTVGTCAATWWDEADGTRVYLLLGEVEPAWRRRGVGTLLVARAEAQVTAHLARHPSAGPALLGLNVDRGRTDVDSGRTDVEALARATGFTVRFHVVTLGRDPVGAPAPVDPDRVEVGPADLDDLGEVRRVLRRCFERAGLGQEERDWTTVDLDVARTLVARADGGVVAVVAGESESDGSVDVPWVAVDAAWRRRGLASALLTHLLHRLADEGVPRATIRTVAENPHRTVDLYRRLGFEEVDRAPRWARPVRRAPGE